MSGITASDIRSLLASRPLLLVLCCATAWPAYAEESMTVEGYYRDPRHLSLRLILQHNNCLPATVRAR